MNYKTLISILIIGGIFWAILSLESSKPIKRVEPATDQTVPIVLDTIEKVDKSQKYELAKEISTPDGFINTDFDGDGIEDGITINELLGEKVVLLDIWTYSCINCQRTLPHLILWDKKYRDDGLMIIGLHTPEFDFEKEYDNVKRAVEKWGVTYPVVLDNDYSTWTSYKNQYWPRKYLIDVDGFIVYDHIGEGGYEETEARIVEALNELKERKGQQSIAQDMEQPTNLDIVAQGSVRSPEVYLGYARLEYINNLPTNACGDVVCEFEVPEYIGFNELSFDGSWKIEKEESTLVSDKGSIFFKFSANKVNLVAGAEGGARAEVYLDGVLVSDKAGAHVNNGIVEFGAYDLYNLIDLQGDYKGEHIIEIRFLEAGIAAFAFTFG